MDLRICIPAWGQSYVDLARRYTIPSLLAALNGRTAKFIIHTTTPEQFQGLNDVEFHPVQPAKHFHASQAAAHRKALADAPEGSVVMLMNADVVVSAGVFDEAERILTGDIKVISALGLRCLIRDTEPPIGVSPRELLAWSWANRHPINEDCVWGRGRTGIPTLLFFERVGSVTAHCFHLHPMFIRKGKPVSFAGTIDNDLLAQFTPGEIHTVCDREMAFAELSPATKKFSSVAPLTVDRLVRFGKGRFTEAHRRSFAHQIKIIGDEPMPDQTPREILTRMGHRF